MAPRRLIRSFLFSLLRVAVCVAAVICGLLLVFQDRLIYLPRRYPTPVSVPPGVERVDFTTGQGQQACWWIPPHPGHDRAWLVFSGNASLALGWRNYLTTADGLLLIDYPGYGASAGSPSPAAILEVSDGAVAAIAGRQPKAVRWAVLGHSLGGAAALQYAAKHPVERIVLVAPFRRMLDMAQRVVGWPLCHLLRHCFDNVARLSEILAVAHPPTIAIWHGTADEIIPFAMSQGLVESFPAIRLHPVFEADHNGILGEIGAQLLLESKSP